MFSIYRLFARVFPIRIKDRITKLLEYSNIDIEINSFLGFQLSFSALLSLVAAVYLMWLLDYNFWIALVVSFIIIQSFICMWLVLSADKKGKFTESILPDVLQLMASNLKAGATIDRALFMSARPEFGPFKRELDRVGREIATGKDLKKSLLDLSSRIKSEKLQKTAYIIISGLKSGGNLAPLLERTAQDLRDQQIMDKKIRSSIGMYTIFIFIAIGIASPFLFSLSSVVVEILTKTFSTVNMPRVSNLPIGISKVGIDPVFVKNFSLAFISTSCILGSLVLGLISRGKAKEGAKYIIPLIILAFVIFFAVRKILMASLGGLFGI